MQPSPANAHLVAIFKDKSCASQMTTPYLQKAMMTKTFTPSVSITLDIRTNDTPLKQVEDVKYLHLETKSLRRDPVMTMLSVLEGTWGHSKSQQHLEII